MSRLPPFGQAIVPVTFVIAKDGSSLDTSRADYVCSAGSTSDQITINQAISDLPAVGGKIALLEGTYNIDNSILPDSNVEITGCGYSTEIRASAAMNRMILVDTKNNVNVNNIRLNANSVANYGLVAGTTTESRFEKLYIQLTTVTAYGIYIATSSYCMIGKNIIKNNKRGIVTEQCTLMNIIDNYITDNSGVINGNGMWILNGSYHNILENRVEKSGTSGILLQAQGYHNLLNNAVISSSQDIDDTYANIELHTSNYNNIQLNNCKRGALANKAKYGIYVNGAGNIGNFVTNNDLHDSGSTASFLDTGTATITAPGNRV